MKQEINLYTIKTIHFVGIGGIGISAAARLMHRDGKNVSGSDGSDTALLHDLEKEGITVYVGHAAEHVPKSCDLLVYTIAISKDNPELTRAHEMGIPTISYPEVLGLISKGKYTIAVSGTHGKTTTTAMIAKILIDAGKDPSVIIGSLLKKPRTNFIHGESSIFLVEACEYRRSFLNLNPNILIINNIEEDHLDYYKDLEDIKEAFRTVAQKVPKDGFIICDTSDPTIQEVIKGSTASIINYKGYAKHDIKLLVPGEHNKSNAQAALALGECLSIEVGQSLRSLESFEGTWRRAEKKGELSNGILIFDDYAHHPTEIQATLSGFRERYPDKNIVVVFQPHLYSRTKEFFNEFVESFTTVDSIIMLPIYAAREPEDPAISSEMMVAEIKKYMNAYVVDTFDEASDLALHLAGSNGLILTMGAGDVYKVSEKIVSEDNI